MYAECSNVAKYNETNGLQLASRLHYHFFIVFIHMHTSSAINYALNVDLNLQKHLADDVRYCITQLNRLFRCWRLFAMGGKQRHDLYLF